MTTEGSGGNMYMPVAPAYGYGYGGGNGFGGDWGSWIILFLIFGMFGNGWGNGMGGGNGMYPWLNQMGQMNDGFQNQMLNTQAMGIQNAVTSGFGDVQTALCGGFAGVTASVTNAQNALAQQMYTNQIAELERSFAAQTASTQGMTGLQQQLAQCCCDNRLATTQTQNVIQSDGAATRLAIQGGIQTVLDKMCQDKIDEKNEKIAELNNRINALESNNYVQNALTAQTQYFINRYPVPTTTTATAG